MTCPRDCPRYEDCCAPICPFDPDWQRRTHLPGERVCGLLCELVKQGGEARLGRALRDELVHTLARVAPDISARWSDVRHKLNCASRQGSKLESGQRLQNVRAGAMRGGHG